MWPSRRLTNMTDTKRETVVMMSVSGWRTARARYLADGYTTKSSDTARASDGTIIARSCVVVSPDGHEVYLRWSR